MRPFCAAVFLIGARVVWANPCGPVFSSQVMSWRLVVCPNFRGSWGRFR